MKLNRIRTLLKLKKQLQKYLKDAMKFLEKWLRNKIALKIKDFQETK